MLEYLFLVAVLAVQYGICHGAPIGKTIFSMNYECFLIFKNFHREVKGALDNILEFSFWLNSIYQVNIDCLFTSTKRKIQKFLQKMKKSSVLVKHALSGDEANLYS